MNGNGFFNPFGISSNSGGGGGTSEKVRYSIKKVTDQSTNEVSYKLVQTINSGPETVAGTIISFNGSQMLVSYGGELVLLNSAIADIESQLDTTYNFTTFSELNINTQNKTLVEITQELIAKNLPTNTIVTGQLYSAALPFSGNGEAEVIVNSPAYWWKCGSLNVAPYSWSAITASSSWGDNGLVMDWTPTTYTLPEASADTLGGIKVGSGLNINDGVLSAESYTLPEASANTLGGIKVGSGLSIDANGVLSASSGADQVSYDNTNSGLIATDVQDAIDELKLEIDTNEEQTEYTFKHLSEKRESTVPISITTGYYVSGVSVGDDWTEHLSSDSGSQYTPVAFYLGASHINKELKVTVRNYKGTSGRCFGFCDENNEIVTLYKENYSIWEQNQDGTYTATLTITAPYFFFSYSNYEIISFKISEDLLNKTGYVAPDGSDDNGGSSRNFAFATISKALEQGCEKIILVGGKYYQQVDLSSASGKSIEIVSYDRAYRPVFYDPDCVLVETATLDDGVYSATINTTIATGNKWLYQEGVADISTQIADSERLPLQRGKTYRNDDTRIEKCSADNLTDALAEIKSSNIYKWYIDSDTLYFSAPQAPSSNNPICVSTGKGLFVNADRSISVSISGIECKYISLNFKNLCNVNAVDCKATNIFDYGAISWDNTLNAYFLRCEAASCYKSGNGDGFNADVTNTGEAFAKHYTATLVDCWAHDNSDDGYSDHRHAETTIIGGLFEYNGKGGLTPAYGAHCSCYNVYSRRNYSGFMCVGEVEQAEGGKYTQLICHSCIAELNNRGGYYAGFVVKDDGNRMILIDCKSIGNTNAYYIGQTANAKLIDCTATGQQTLFDGYPENATVETTVVGKNVAGTTYTIDGQDVVALAGAEIFNAGKIEDGGYVVESNNKAIGAFSHAEGFGTTAYGNFSHAEGLSTTASGAQSHAEGSETIASGKTTHAEGNRTTASYTYAHAEGSRTTASGYSSHAEGGNTTASGDESHAEGYYTTASGTYSHAEGHDTIAAANNQHVQGKYNIAQGDLNTQMAFIIGNGTSDLNRSNAFAIDWDGKIYQGNTNDGVSLADQQKQIDYAINTGAKNLYEISGKNETYDTVTFTLNADGTITAATSSATTTASNQYMIGTFIPPKTGEYIISAGLSATASAEAPSTTFCVQLRLGTSASTGLIERIGKDPVTVTLTAGETYSMRFYFASGQTINEVIKPMIRFAEIKDDTFVAYAPTNRELYSAMYRAKMTLPDNVDLDDVKIGGIYHGVNSTGWNATHMPVANGGFNFSLMVIESGEFILQIFKQLNGAGDPDIYIRRFYVWNISWDSWYKFTGVPV